MEFALPTLCEAGSDGETIGGETIGGSPMLFSQAMTIAA